MVDRVDHSLGGDDRDGVLALNLHRTTVHIFVTCAPAFAWKQWIRSYICPTNGDLDWVAPFIRSVPLTVAIDINIISTCLIDHGLCNESTRVVSQGVEQPIIGSSPGHDHTARSVCGHRDTFIHNLRRG